MPLHLSNYHFQPSTFNDLATNHAHVINEAVVSYDACLGQ